jgi:hypothetical protein
MTTTEHNIVKPAKLVETALGFLEQELIVPRLFQKEGIDQFKGSENDTITIKVEGVLPHHTYGWRNDRTNPITFDAYAERTTTVAFQGNYYSAVKLTDEQNDFDIENWAKLLRPQARAVGRALQRGAVSTLTDQTYEVTIGNAEQDLRGALVEARRVLNAFNVPDQPRTLLVGSQFESALLNDDELNFASNVGDNQAESALTNATIGRRFGFTVVTDQTIGATDAYALVPSAFIFLSGAPSVPQSVPFGATDSFEGIALRWVRDYDPTYLQDRSVVNTYAGFRAVEDPLVYWDPTANGGLGSEVVTASEYFVRAVKLTLDGSSNYPAYTNEVAVATGVSDTAVWTPSGYAHESAVENS